ncbi:MAG: DUF4124 domain-containing protein [Desulfobacterales bacterium]|jgi:hypothetical protein
MKLATAFFTMIIAGIFVTPLDADIYSWTDENGVKHFSNAPPADAENVTVEFKEYQYDAKADRRRIEMDEEEWESIFRQAESEERKERQQAEAERRNREPTRDELIESEKQRLFNKIKLLEEKPLDYFGSFKNKRVRIGFYKYRLEALMQDPDKYFKEPVTFEGNVKETE